MKLTNEIRRAFVAKVMADVPKVDYDEQIRDFVVKLYVDELPASVRRVWECNDTRAYVNLGWPDIEGIHIGVSVEVPSRERYGTELEISTEKRIELTELVEKRDNQSMKMMELRRKIESVALSVATTNALIRQLPEFAKYLPEEAKQDRSVPAIANLVKDLVEAGWPKGGKPIEA